MTNYQPVRIAYKVFEPNSGADPNLSPLIYAHGVTAFKEHWGDIPQIVANATGRKAYAIDARNHGDSEWSDYFNFDVNADDLIHFMDTLGINKAIIVGHSMGGITAIKAALKRPDRIERIVVEDMVVRRLHKQILDMVLQYVRLARAAINALPPDLDEEGAQRFIMNYVRSNLQLSLLNQEMPIKKQDPDEDVRFIKIRRGPDGRFMYKANMEAIERAMSDCSTLSSEAKGVFDGPTCFIYGRLSPFLVYYNGADEHHIRQHFPNAVFEWIEEATHDVHTEKPVEFTDAVVKFLS